MAVEGYDLVMIGILAVAALLGYFKGIVWQLAWIAGIVASSFVALNFATQLAPLFGEQAPWNRFLAMLALYVGTSLAVWLLFRLVSGFISAIHLSAFDHQLGLLMGLAKGALLCIVVTFFAVTLAPNYRHQIVASRSGRFVAELIVRADVYLPKNIHDTVEPFVNHFERQFAQPGMGQLEAGQAPAPLFGQGAGGQPAGQVAGSPISIQSLIQGVTSAAAWAGPEQGGGAVQQAGGALPAGSAWFAPKETQALQSAIQSALQPAIQSALQPPSSFQAGPAAPVPAAPQAASPRSSGSRYGGAPQPSAYPIGAQSALPVR